MIVKQYKTYLFHSISLCTFITTQIDKNIDLKGMHVASLVLQRYVSTISNGALQLLDKLDALSKANVVGL